MATLRIISTPPGEAPVEIREGWVGLKLRLAMNAPRDVLGRGVLSGRSEAPTRYVVYALDAFAALSELSPEATAWWRANKPHLFHAHRTLTFDASCCREIFRNALYPGFEREVLGQDGEGFDGRSLAETIDELNEIAADAGVHGLYDFLGTRPSPLEAGLADLYGPNVPSEWFAAADGLATVNALLARLGSPAYTEEARADLERLRDLLTAADAQGVGFQMLLDI
jgi:hypothetical protein